MLIKLYNGRYSLADTFWLGVFLVGIIFLSADRVLLAESLGVSNDFVSWFNKARVALIVLHTVHLILMLRALWLSGHDNRSLGAWGWVGVVYVAIFMSSGIFACSINLVPGAPKPLFLAEKKARDVNKTLPAKIDNYIIAQSVVVEDKIYKIRYKINLEASAAEEEFYARPPLSEHDERELCMEMRGYFRGGLKGVEYTIEYTNKTFVRGFSASECLSSL